MLTLKELRKRKQVQWALAYAAGAWVLLQVLGLISESYDWPHVAMQVAIGLVVVGFCIVMVLAWYHGERGEQKFTGMELTFLTLLLAFGGAWLWHTSHSVPTTTIATATPSQTVAASPTPDSIPSIESDPSIAVLPFENLSSDKEQGYFSDGISEELLNLLAKVPKLRVIARTSSFSFKGKAVAIPDIGRALDVSSILQGSVRKSGDKVRITVQLVRAADGTQVWSEAYDRQLTDVFAIQDEIAATVVGQLKITLLGGLPRTRTEDSRAFSLFLQAREIGRQNSPTAYEQSIALYQQALELDPGYAAAWVGLANIYCYRMSMGPQPASVGVPLARNALERALAIDPDNAPALALFGWVDMINGDFAAAARHVGRALALDPTNPYVTDIAAFLARRLGRMEQAIAFGEYTRVRDPVNADNLYDLAMAYRYAGRLDEAITSFRSVLSLSPAYLYAHAAIGEILLQQGRKQEALAEIQQEADEQNRLGSQSMAFFSLGRKAESDAALDTLISKYGATAAAVIAYVLADRGEVDHAMAWLGTAVRNRDFNLGMVALFPTMTRLSSDPRYLPLLRKAGLAPEQLAKVKFKAMPPR